MEKCKECLKSGVYRPGQGHHVVSRKIPYMKHIPINIVPLCMEHHTSSPKGIHHNREMMIRYKQELQLQLTLLFTKEYYTFQEIKSLLNCSDNSVKAITKTIPRYKEGYKKEVLIFHMMGDENFL